VAEPSDVWYRIYEKAGAHGPEALTKTERTLYRVNVFLTDFENGGLSGFLYNVSPSQGASWAELRSIAAAVAAVGDADTAAALEDAAVQLEAHPCSEQSTWAAFMLAAMPASDTLESRLSVRVNSLWERLEGFTLESAAALSQD